MKRREFIGKAGAAAAAGAAFSGAGRSAMAAEFKPLFNGRDLTGWVPVGTKPGAWKAADGILSVEGGSGWLRSEREYGRFVLKLEWKLPPGGNSGVFLRAPAEGNGAYEGVEIQVLDHFHPQYKDIKPTQFTGSIYDLVPAKQEGLKPAGEWNAYEITHDGDHIVVVLNGIEIVNADVSKFQDRLKEHPGIARKKGYIGFQAHDTKVEFRNIELKEL